jgi:hypothetical protein
MSSPNNETKHIGDSASKGHGQNGLKRMKWGTVPGTGHELIYPGEDITTNGPGTILAKISE